MTNLDPITLTILAVLALLGGVGWIRSVLGRTKQTPQSTPPPPPHTAEDHANAQANETPDAVDAAAAEHGADPADVASDLEWADSVRRAE